MISPSLPGVTVSIAINSQSLPEHTLSDLDQIDSRTTDRLVEAQSNQIFTINLTADTSTDFKGHDLACKILVDGRYIETPLISRDMVEIQSPWTEISDGIHTTKDYVRRYQFMELVAVAENTTSLSSRSTSMRSAISRSYSSSAPTSGRPTPMTSMNSAPRMSEAALTPSMSMSSDASERFSAARPPPFVAPRPHYTERELSELGTIKVVVSHVDMNGGPMTFSGSGGGRLDFGGHQPVKPGLTQRVGFTAPEKTAAVSTFGTTKVAGVPNPAATFIFHYRAKEAIDAFLALPLDAIKEEEEGDGVKVKKEAAESEFDPIAEEPAVPVKEESNSTSPRESAFGPVQADSKDAGSKAQEPFRPDEEVPHKE